MTNTSKGKGDRGEREVEALLQGFGIKTARRELGAGRKDDMGDIGGVPQTAIQVAWWEDWRAAINTKIVTVERQRKNKRVRFAASFIRRTRSEIPWIVTLTPQQWFTLWKYAQMGVALERKQKATRLPNHDRRRSTGKN